MRLAEELGLPLVTVIDTPGAELSVAAEEGAIAGEIARCIATLTTMTVPTVSVILGQGCGGGALALLPAQVVVATENAWLSPLPPEGASVICTATSTTRPRWPSRRASAPPPCWRPASCTTSYPSSPTTTPESLAKRRRAVANALVRLAERWCEASRLAVSVVEERAPASVSKPPDRVVSRLACGPPQPPKVQETSGAR